MTTTPATPHASPDAPTYSSALGSILNEVRLKRQYQDTRWGHAFDDKNTINDWNTYIGMELARGTTMKANKELQRKALLDAAALAVAALEAFDRNEGFPPRHYEDQVAK